MAKKQDETPYERQERRHREERKRRHRQIADDWLRTRKPDVRPGLILIVTEVNVKDGRELPEPKIEREWIKIPRRHGRPKNSTKIEIDHSLPSRVKATIKRELEHGNEPLKFRKHIASIVKGVGGETDLKRKLRACGTTFRELKSECKKEIEKQ